VSSHVFSLRYASLQIRVYFLLCFYLINCMSEKRFLLRRMYLFLKNCALKKVH
jgi:hypothetical protein